MSDDNDKPVPSSDEASETKPKRRWWQKKRFGMPLIVFGLMAGWWLHQAWFYPIVFWYRVTAQLEYQGQPVEVGGVVTCRRSIGFWVMLIEPFTGGNFSFGPSNGVDRYPYFTNTVAFAKRLPDGSAVIMRHTMTCNSRMHQRLTHGAGKVRYYDGLQLAAPPTVLFNGNEPSRFPLIHWIDDAEHPQRAETYFADIYYNDPRARFRFLEFTLERLSFAEVPDPADMMKFERERIVAEVPWLDLRDPAALESVHGYVFDEAEWSNDPETKTVVANTNGALIDPAIELGRERFWSQRELNPHIGFGFRCAAALSNVDSTDNSPPVCKLLQRQRLFLNTDSCWQITDRPLIPGMAPLYPVNKPNKTVSLNSYCFPGRPPYEAWLASFFLDQKTGCIYRTFLMRLHPLGPLGIIKSQMDHY